jgi:hypothetical protein
MKFFAGFLALLLCCTSCEKTINLKPQNLEPELVVDGSIETGQPPIIILSRSLSYFSAINPAILSGSQVHDAKIIVSDGTRTHQLKEYTQAVGGGYSISYYSTDSSNLATAIVGQAGSKYTLTINIDAKQYTAATQIPLLDKTLDTLWWKQAPGKNDSSKVVLMTRVTDPKGYGNYIRYFTKVNDGAFLPGINSVFDDQIVDGSTYEIQVDQGINRNDPPDIEEYGYFAKGDSVTVKFCNIDKSTFDFWRTLEYSYQSIGNPFSSPTTILGNVSMGALGAFCGYSVQYKSLIIPK